MTLFVQLSMRLCGNVSFQSAESAFWTCLPSSEITSAKYFLGNGCDIGSCIELEVHRRFSVPSMALKSLTNRHGHIIVCVVVCSLDSFGRFANIAGTLAYVEVNLKR